MDIRSLNTLLTTLRVGKPVEWHESLGSTNTMMRTKAQSGAAEGLVLGADAQTAGRGRFNRVWESGAGENLLFSVLLRPSFGMQHYPLLNFLAALSVAEAIELYPSLHAALHWPNDVYINNKKVCGILSETEGESVIIGIGLNVNQREFPEELLRATSLAIESGATLDRGRLLHILLKTLDENYNDVIENGFANVMEKWRAQCEMFDKPVAIQNGGVTIEGIAESLADDGALCVRKANGELIRVYAGDATLHNESVLSANG